MQGSFKIARYFLSFAFFLCLVDTVWGQGKGIVKTVVPGEGKRVAAKEVQTDKWLEKLLRREASPALLHVLNNPDSFRYQIIYTTIDRDKGGRPAFTNHYYHVDRSAYFNPASTVKMPLAFLALEKASARGIDKWWPMLTDSAYSGQTVVTSDTSAADGMPSLANYIKKIFLVSDNDAYNRLYEFLGQEYINRRLTEMGYRDVRITRRFVPMTEEENRHTNPIRFMKGDRVVWSQAAQESKWKFNWPSTPILIGKGHWDRNDSLIQAPMDFTHHNNVPLEDLQRMLQSVVFPGSVPGRGSFKLTASDHAFLYRYMSEYPSESAHPRYDTAEYFDSYAKFFMFKAGKRRIPFSIRVFNKPGWSYGFLTDVAYIVDFEHKMEFMLSGVIYVNRDGILNDDKYEYDEVGYPFFKEVGEIIYHYELKRKRSYAPDLSRFKIDHRQPD